MSSLIGIHTDTMLWLHNKLRNDDNPWSSGGIASQFTNDILLDIYDRFIQLESKDKIKILLAMLEIPLRNMEGLKESISRIVALAEEDLDEWVRVAANIVRDYPEHFEIDQRLGKVTTHFQQTVHEIVAEIERIQLPINPNLIPGECLYLNPTALSKVISSPPPPAKHFTLRRKPKSAELRAKITQKATDAVNQRRSMHPSGTTSKATLKRTHSLPSGKLLPVQHSKSGLSKALPKKTKVLEYKDQPIGFREQKKRKKAQAMETTHEEPTKHKKKGADSTKQTTEKETEEKEKDTSMEKRPDEETDIDHQEPENFHKSQDEPGTSTDGGESSAPTTPTFSREEEKGTSSAAEEEQAPLTPPPKATPPTPSYAILPTASKDPTPLSGPGERLNTNPPESIEPNVTTTTKTTKKRRRTSSTMNQKQSQVPPVVDEQLNQPSQQQPQPVVQLSHNVNNLINVNPNSSINSQNFQRELQMHVRQEQELRLKHKQQIQQQQQHQQIHQQQQQQQQQLYSQQFMQQQQHIRQNQQQQPQQHGQLPPPFPGPGGMSIPSGMGLPPGATLPGMSLQPPQPHMIGSQQKKGLSLTRDQMLAAQEMFRSANSVTRAEKALILGFMAGARENPFPQQGSVITIKLSEELIPQGDQHTLVEMLFEMNYDTGHWRRLKRTRVMQQGAQPGVNS